MKRWDNRRPQGSGMVAIAVVSLGMFSAATPGLAGEGSARIGLSPEVVALEAGPGNHLTLELTPKHRQQDWDFQWQKDDRNIPGATADTYRDMRIDLSDAGRYRCRVRSKDGMETNFTMEVFVQVHDTPQKRPKPNDTAMLIAVAGPVQTGTAPTATCVSGNARYLRLKCAKNPDPRTGCRNDSIYWCFPEKTKNVLIENTTPGTTVKIEVTNSAGTPVASCQTNRFPFQPETNQMYQIILYRYSGSATTLTANVSWSQ